jgi:hypothetical protein
MKRVPKFTAGMFKPKMKRFSGPKIKKFAEGGDTDDLVPYGMLPDENAAELAARARGSKGPSKRFRNKPSPPVIEEEVVVDPKEFYKEKMRERQMEQDRAKKEREEFDRMYEDRKRREREAESEWHRRRKAGIQTARAGGAIKAKKYARGGGVEIKGKTRGKFV